MIENTEVTVSELARRLRAHGYRIHRHHLAVLIKSPAGPPYRLGRKRYDKRTLLIEWPGALDWFGRYRARVEFWRLAYLGTKIAHPRIPIAGSSVKVPATSAV